MHNFGLSAAKSNSKNRFTYYIYLTDDLLLNFVKKRKDYEPWLWYWYGKGCCFNPATERWLLL